MWARSDQCGDAVLDLTADLQRLHHSSGDGLNNCLTDTVSDGSYAILSGAVAWLCMLMNRTEREQAKTKGKTMLLPHG